MSRPSYSARYRRLFQPSTQCTPTNNKQGLRTHTTQYRLTYNSSTTKDHKASACRSLIKHLRPWVHYGVVKLLVTYTMIKARKVPVPCSPEVSSNVAIILLYYFFLSTCILSHDHGFLLRLIGSFLLRHRHADVFTASATTSVHCLLLLVLRAYVLINIYVFDCFGSVRPRLMRRIPPKFLLKVCVNIYLLCLYLG